MKKTVLIGTLTLLAGALLAADSSSVQAVKKAAKKLADKNNYSWTSTMEFGGNSQWRPRPSEGKTEKSGLTCFSMTWGENTMQMFMKGEKGAIKTADGWYSRTEATQSQSDQPNPTRFLARMMENFQAPTVQAEDLASKAKDLSEANGVYSGSLTDEAVKELLTFRRRSGGSGPTIGNPKGSVKFWIKDGLLTKYQFHLQGTMTFNDNDRDIDRTTTVEIKDVDTTKITLPDEAKKKMS